MRAAVEQGHPELYRHWALYLQVLREGLAAAVERACFHLAVEVAPQRYRAMPASNRQSLHRRIGSLVQRCCALLTVEQLQALAAQMRRRERRRARAQQRQVLREMQRVAEAPAPSEPAPVPEGSVRLDLALPISTPLFGPAPADASPFLGASGSPPEQRDREELLAAFSSLFDDAGRVDDPDAPRHSGLMPSEPLPLLHWFDALDAALARRLRNLSHALNVEVVRLGLGSALLPLRLLEAAAEGQLEVLNAPANLLRLALPSLPTAGLSSEAVVLLLRPADLEAEQSRLRTCRVRLQQARQEIRTMAQTYHRLESRLQALEAEQLWLHDHSTAQMGRTPPSS